MARFSIVKKGYSIDDVEGFITKILSLTEEKLAEQTSRIKLLKGEINDLTNQKAELKAREASVSQALFEAMRRSNEIDRAIEARYSIELNRLKAFRRRFSDLLSDITDRPEISVKLSQFDQKVKDIESEIETVMIEEFNLDQNPISDLKESSDAFDLDEAINPKETLEDICRELGLI